MVRAWFQQLRTQHGVGWNQIHPHLEETWLRASKKSKAWIHKWTNHSMIIGVSVQLRQTLQEYRKSLAQGLAKPATSTPTSVQDYYTLDMDQGSPPCHPGRPTEPSPSPKVSPYNPQVTRHQMDCELNAARLKGNSDHLRNYESLLNVVLSQGSIEKRKKQFLDEYRECLQIDIEEHKKALERLGWTPYDYQRGSRQPRSFCNEAYDVVMEFCHQHGNTIITIGSLVSLTSLTMSSMRHLRCLQICAGFLYFTYNISRQPALKSPAYWNAVFILINSIMMYRLQKNES